MSREGWTPLQIAWADRAAAETAYEVALASVGEASDDIEFWEPEADGDIELAPEVPLARERLAAAKRALRAAEAAVPVAEAALRAAERAHWAVTPMTRQQIASNLAISPDTWSGYVSRGQAPGPDGRDDTGHPWWSELTVRTWAASRPGQGARSDRVRDAAR